MAKTWRIDEMIRQMGGLGFRGAFGYVGASQITYKDREDLGTPNASKVLEGGFVEWETGLVFKVNGKPKSWKMIVTLEPSDTYTVRLWEGFSTAKMAKTGDIGKVITEVTDVYCDELQRTVEQVYDDAVKQYNGGFIRLG